MHTSAGPVVRQKSPESRLSRKFLRIPYKNIRMFRSRQAAVSIRTTRYFPSGEKTGNAVIRMHTPREAKNAQIRGFTQKMSSRNFLESEKSYIFAIQKFKN